MLGMLVGVVGVCKEIFVVKLSTFEYEYAYVGGGMPGISIFVLQGLIQYSLIVYLAASIGYVGPC